MNYHRARQRADGRGWLWTTMHVWTSGGCAVEHVHPTREDAERCFYDHELTRLVPVGLRDQDEQRQCAWRNSGTGARCGASTRVGLLSNMFGGPTWLCDEHRTPSYWGLLHPFEPGIEITASW